EYGSHSDDLLRIPQRGATACLLDLHAVDIEPDGVRSIAVGRKLNQDISSSPCADRNLYKLPVGRSACRQWSREDLVGLVIAECHGDEAVSRAAITHPKAKRGGVARERY